MRFVGVALESDHKQPSIFYLEDLTTSVENQISKSKTQFRNEFPTNQSLRGLEPTVPRRKLLFHSYFFAGDPA